MATGRLQDRWFFLAVCAALFGLTASWSLAMPLFAGPDEPAHVLEAAGVVRGDALGRTESRPPPFTTVTIVAVPGYLVNAQQLPVCFAFQPAVTAGCQPGLATGSRDAPAETFVGHYPPLYYVLVGLPTLVLDGPRAIYAMRAVSAALGASVLALGVLLLRRTATPRWALAGAAVAITPMTAFLTGVVNPSGLEVAAGFTAWAALLPLALDPQPQWVRRRLLVGALALAVLMNLRPSSPLWALLIVLTVVLVMTRGRWPLVLARGAWIVPVVVGVLASVVAVGWLVVADPTRSLGGFPSPELAAGSSAVQAALARTPEYLRQLIGNYGWLDTSASALTVTVWVMAIGGLVLLALATGTRRQRLAILLLGSAVIVLPVVLQVASAADIGLIWQGRYILPLAVGFVLLSALVIGARAEPGLPSVDAVILPAVAVAGVVSFYWALRRFTVGADGPYLTASGSWSPPFGLVALVLVHALLYAALVVLLRRGGSGSAGPLLLDRPARDGGGTADLPTLA